MDLVRYFRSGHPCIVIETFEDKRARRECIRQARTEVSGAPLFDRVMLWTVTEGFRDVTPRAQGGVSAKGNGDDIYKAVKYREKRNVLIFEDISVYDIQQDPELNRGFKDLIRDCEEEYSSCVIFLGVSFRPPREWERLVTYVEYSLPGREELGEILDGAVEAIRKTSKDFSLDNGEKEAVINAARGMTTTEASNAFPLAYIETEKISAEVVSREKMKAVEKSGYMKFIPQSTTFKDIGGVGGLKIWVSKRRNAYSKKAREFGLPIPRGILLTGVPGTGKSLAAKTVGSVLGLPTLRLDYGALFGSLVGESERRAREAFMIAEAASPLVLWIDEIDKAAGGTKSDLDSGVGRRVLGNLLTWMQDRDADKPVFMIATANQVEFLPPELLRKGRFDEIFALDLPTLEERMEIFKIHILKVGRKPGPIKIHELALQAKDFTGSEIEECVRAAMFSAFDAGSDLNTKFISGEIGQTVPLAKSMESDISRIRDWIGKRARNASDSTGADEVGGRRIIGN